MRYGIGLCTLMVGFLVNPLSLDAALAAPDASKSSEVAPASGWPEKVFQLQAMWVGEAWHNKGAFKEGSMRMQGVDVSLGIDVSKLGWKGASFFFEGFRNNSDSYDIQNVLALSAPSALDAYLAAHEWQLYQAYLEQKIGDTSLLIGKYDVITQFGTTRPMDVFANRSAAMNMAFMTATLGSGFSTASNYPATSFGARLKHVIDNEWMVKFGVLNGLSDTKTTPWKTAFKTSSNNGVMLLGEIDYTPMPRTKLMAGVWGFTSKLKVLDEFKPNFTLEDTYGAQGFYLGGAHRIYTIEGHRGVDAFFTFGHGPAKTSVVDMSFLAGITAVGPFASRPDDKLGISVSYSDLSEPCRNLSRFQGISLAGAEYVLEVTYKAVVGDWLVVQPDFQYIGNPSGQFNVDDALVFGCPRGIETSVRVLMVLSC